MGSISAYLTRIELRRRVPSFVLIAAITALVVGTTLASVAGANRSASAFDRYLAEVQVPHAMAFGDPDTRRRFGSLEGVEAAVEMELIAAFPMTDGEDFFPLLLSADGTVPFERTRYPVVEGRFPQRDAPHEAALSERTAERMGVGVGGVITLATLSPEATERLNEEGTFEPDGPEIELEVTGIVRDPGDIASRDDDITLTFLTPAFREAHPPAEVGALDEGTLVYMRDGRPLSELTEAAEGSEVELDSAFFETTEAAAPTMRAIATALRLFAAVVGLAGLMAILQSVARVQQSAARDDGTLDALGTTSGERWTRLAVPAAMAAGLGAVLGAVAAIPASSLFPVGLARRAEPDPGVRVDVPVLLVGVVAAIILLAAGIGVLAAWRVRQQADPGRSGRVSWWSRSIGALGGPPAAVTGVSLAAGTPGRPGRVAMVGTLISVLGVLAALVFSASVDRLNADPALYGWGWTLNLEGEDLTHLADTGGLPEALADDPDVTAHGKLYSQVQVILDGDPQFATAAVPLSGSLAPVMVRGDAPVAADELAVGRDTLRRIGARVGDVVEVEVLSRSQDMRISGVVALAVPEDGGSSASGAFLSPAGADALRLPQLCAPDQEGSCTETIAVDLRDGVDVERWGAGYEARFPDLGINATSPRPPGEVTRLTAVEDLPRYLAGFLALLAATAVSFAVATTVRERRRDLAILRVLGMTGRHVRAVVIVLVAALTAAGAIAGGVLGLVAGRQVWRAVTTSVSLPFAPSLPLLGALIVPVAAVLLAQVVATVSRRAAGRIPAALVLRAE
jgi:hypothetical protein